MKLEDIKSEEDVSRYIEGCLNDMYFGIADKEQTSFYLHQLIIYIVKLDRVKNVELRQ